MVQARDPRDQRRYDVTGMPARRASPIETPTATVARVTAVLDTFVDSGSDLGVTEIAARAYSISLWWVWRTESLDSPANPEPPDLRCGAL